MKYCRHGLTSLCTLTIAIICVVIYNIVDERYYDESTFTAPIINDVFKQHREESNISIYEMNEIFLTFSNTNIDKQDHIIFYTINGSDPRQYGIAYDDNEESEIGIVIPISKVRGVDKPVPVQAVIGKLGFLDQIIWSKVEKKTFWNPNHLNHTKFGAGFSEIPRILSGTHTIGHWFAVRLKPQRLTDIAKCAYSNDKNAKILSQKKVFWSDMYASKTINVSQSYLLGNSHIDVVFDDPYFTNWNGLIYVKCSTASKSASETVKNTDYSSLLMPTKPRYTQLFPQNNHRLGKIRPK